MTLGKIAGMMQREFLDMKKEMHTVVNEATNKTEKKLAGKINSLKSEIKDVKSDTGRILRQERAEVERDDRQDLHIKNHEERIVVLEKEKEIV